MKIEEVLEKNQESLMDVPGVVGVGIGESEGKPALIVMVRERSPALRRSLPLQLDGFPVKVETTGEPTAF